MTKKPSSRRPFITWSLYESNRTKCCYRISNFLLTKNKIRLAIPDWNELPSDIYCERDKKFHKHHATFFYSFLTGTLVCGRLLAQHGVSLNLGE